MSSKTDVKTEPATEENLALEIDMHPFMENPPQQLSELHPVIIDGKRGLAAVGCFGGYSTRIVVKLEEEHPDLGLEFGTKYFRIDENGKVSWGHEDKTFQIDLIVE